MVFSSHARPSDEVMEDIESASRLQLKIQNVIETLYSKSIAAASHTLDLITWWIKDNGFWYQLSLSLFSAVIFYIAFTSIPYKIKHKKLRPIIDSDLTKIKSEIFSIFNLITSPAPHLAIYPLQRAITTGSLTQELIELYLQNKCFTTEHCSSNAASENLIPIGETLLEKKIKIESRIEKIFNLSEHTNTEEILLLEKITNHLNTYEIQTKRPIFPSYNPSCDYIAHAYHPLYHCYIELQEKTLKKRNRTDWESLQLADLYVFRSKFKKAIKICRKQTNKNSNYRLLFLLKIAECQYRLGKYEICVKSFAVALNELRYADQTLVSYRYAIEVFRESEIMTNKIIEIFGKTEYEKAIKTLEKEYEFIQNYQLENQSLKIKFDPTTAKADRA